MQRRLACVGTLMLVLSLWGCDNAPPVPQEPSEPNSNSVTEPNQTTSNPAAEAKLREAAKKGHIQTVKLLLEQGTNVNAPDEDQRTALMWAAFDGYTEVVRMLLVAEGNVNHQDLIGRTALMYASSGSNIDTVRLLLAHEADTNLTDNHESWTALMFAAAEGQTAIAQALLDAGADRTLQDTDGETAYYFAMQRGFTETAALVKPPVVDPNESP